MWWNIFMTVFGFVILVVVGAFAMDCFYKLNRSVANEKKAWKRASEGWAILTCIILFNWLVRIFLA